MLSKFECKSCLYFAKCTMRQFVSIPEGCAYCDNLRYCKWFALSGIKQSRCKIMYRKGPDDSCINFVYTQRWVSYLNEILSRQKQILKVSSLGIKS